MSRKLKTFGLGLAATFAMSGVVASAAYATEAKFMAESYPAKITASQTVEHEFRFEVGSGTLLAAKCQFATFEAEIAGATNELTIKATYGNEASMCTAFGLSAEINMNGCDYVFRSGSSTSADRSTGTFGIKCPAGGGPVKIRTTNGVCEIQIASLSNQNLVEINYEDETFAAPKSFVFAPNAFAVVYKETVDGVGCPLTHKGVESADASYSGISTATGASGGVATGITIEP